MHKAKHNREARGNVSLRMPPAMHAHLLLIAEEQKTSLNTLILMMLQRGYERLVQEWDSEEDENDG